MTSKSQVGTGADLVEAVAGDRRAALEAIRDRLAAELTRAKGQSAAAVAKELRATLEALEALPGGKVDAVDELTKRRAERRARAAGGEVGAVRLQRRPRGH